MGFCPRDIVADEHDRYLGGRRYRRVVSGLHRIRSNTNGSGYYRADGSSYEHQRSSCHANGTGNRCTNADGSGDHSANTGTYEHSRTGVHANGATHSCSDCYAYGSNRGRSLGGYEH